MNLTPEILQKKWESIFYTDGGFLQVDVEHPLEWHIGYQSIDQKTLLLISDVEIDRVESSKSMVVTRRRREDNRWVLSFELLKKEQQSVFSIFCCDVIEYSRLVASEKDSLIRVISRYKQWSKLLESQKSGLLDEASRKGLLGELLFLQTLLSNEESHLQIIRGWCGADRAAQDFIYTDIWYEVKSLIASATSVTISSLEQLAGPCKGELIIMRIDKVPLNMVGGISLNEVVSTIEHILMFDDVAIDLFHTKLSAYGYMDISEYSEQKYYHSATQHYRIDDNFPKLTSQSVSAQVIAAHYELSLPALVDWLIE